jgi:hypothetical protein
LNFVAFFAVMPVQPRTLIATMNSRVLGNGGNRNSTLT